MEQSGAVRKSQEQSGAVRNSHEQSAVGFSQQQLESYVTQIHKQRNLQEHLSTCYV